jgi:hypothetical protein
MVNVLPPSTVSIIRGNRLEHSDHVCSCLICWIEAKKLNFLPRGYSRLLHEIIEIRIPFSQLGSSFLDLLQLCLDAIPTWRQGRLQLL